MVVAVVRGPPKGAFLSRSRPDKSEDELKNSASLVAAVREVAVIDPCDAEHTDYVKSHTDRKRRPAKSYYKHQEAPYVDPPKGGLLDQV